MKRCLSLLVLLSMLAGCGSQSVDAQKIEKTVYAMDTVMTMTAYPAEGQTEDDVSAALNTAQGEIQRLDALLSVSNEQGEIGGLNSGERTRLSDETGRLLQRALTIAADTGGAFDPTLYPLAVLWGFSTGAYHVPTEQELDSVLGSVGYLQTSLTQQGESWQVVLPEGGGIDLGGIAKGYTAHEVLEVLERQGISSAILSLGGNVAALGRKPDGSLWTVAVENPDQSQGYLASIQLDGGYFAITSGAYQRYFEEDGKRYHHILNAETGCPAETGLQSVTVVSKDGTLADALSTALFVMGTQEAQRYWRKHSASFDMILYDGEKLYVTPGITVQTDQTIVEVQP